MHVVRIDFVRGARAAVAAMALLLVPTLLAAQGNREAHANHERGGGSASHSFHRHVLDVFAGPTVGVRPSETGFAVGPTYRFQLTERFALAAFGDLAFYSSHTTTTVLAGGFAGITRHLLLGVGAGFEHASTHFVGREHHEEGGTDAAFRIETAYELPLTSGWEIAPTLAVDFIGKHRTTLFGLSFGRGF